MYPIIESEKIFRKRNLNGQNVFLKKNYKFFVEGGKGRTTNGQNLQPDK
jgi:hypothetical protein